MTSLIETIARAIWEARAENCFATYGLELEPWGDGTFPHFNNVTAEARAALKAARIPTEAMVKAGALAGEMYGNTDARATWTAMIDAALAEDEAELKNPAQKVDPIWR